MTVVPPLSACLINIHLLESFASDDSDFCSVVFIFRLIFYLFWASSGLFIVFSTKVSNSCSLPLGGTKFDMFLTRDSSSSSMLSKYSTSHTLGVNSDISFANSCVFAFLGVGVNLRPFHNSFISVSISLRLERLTIWMLVISSAKGSCMVLVLGIKNHFNFEVCYSLCFGWVWVGLV